MTPIPLGDIGGVGPEPTCGKSRNTPQSAMKARLRALLAVQWVTPIDALDKAGCFSLSQRCGGFRLEGLKVIDKWVDLPSGKRVKAYRIEGA